MKAVSISATARIPASGWRFLPWIGREQTTVGNRRFHVRPTIFQFRKFQFFFFSREESRMHVHIHTPEGEAKYWLEPEIELAVTSGGRH
jgi:hypothetical protein